MDRLWPGVTGRWQCVLVGGVTGSTLLVIFPTAILYTSLPTALGIGVMALLAAGYVLRAKPILLVPVYGVLLTVIAARIFWSDSVLFYLAPVSLVFCGGLAGFLHGESPLEGAITGSIAGFVGIGLAGWFGWAWGTWIFWTEGLHNYWLFLIYTVIVTFICTVLVAVSNGVSGVVGALLSNRSTDADTDQATPE